MGYTPSLEEILCKWEQLEVSGNQLALQKRWQIQMRSTHSCSCRILVPEVVAARYESNGCRVGKVTCLPQRRRIFTELVRQATCLLEQGLHIESAAAFSNILAHKPDHIWSNYMLGQLLVGDGDVPADELRAVQLLHTAARQGHFESALNLGYVHIARGKLIDAHVAFELALAGHGILPHERAYVASIIANLREV